MRIVIVGGGKVGYSLAGQLTYEGHDIVLIDNNRNVINKLADTLDIMVMYGNGADLKVLQAADVAHCDLLVAASPMDEINMMCCIIARKLGCQNTIARVRNTEYAEQLYFLKEELGLSMTINPEWTAAREMFRLMQLPGFLQRDSFAKGRVEIVEIILQKDSPLCGLQLFEIPKKLKASILVCAIGRNDEVFIPDGSFRLEEEDKIYVTAPTKELIEIIRKLGLRKHKSRNAMIIGGSRTAQYLASMLLKTGTRVKIIESNEARSAQLADLYPDANVVNADGSNQAVLLAENIEQMDSVITLTNMDEENLIISVYAKHVGVPQVITKINRTEYNEIFRKMGIDCIISPKLLCAQGIVRYVRAMQNTTGSSILSVHRLVEGKVEALEFNVTEHTKHLKTKFRDIILKPNILIVCINRLGKIIIPGGNDTLEVGDTVIAVTTADRVIVDLNDIFSQEP